MAKFFRYPFAISGDRAAVPDTAQVDGSVSYQEGYPVDYQKQIGVDSSAKAILRNQYNQVLYDATLAIQQYQTHGAPDFITSSDNGGSPYPYDIYAIVRYDAGSGVKLYQSRVTSNTSLPTDTTKWNLLNTAIVARASMSATQAVPGSSVVTKVQYNTVNFDPFGMFGVTAFSNWSFTVPYTGYYGLYALTGLGSPSGSGTEWDIIVFKNGSTVAQLDNQVVIPGSNSDSLRGYIEEPATAGDVFDLRIATSSGIDIGGTTGRNYLGISYVGAA